MYGLYTGVRAVYCIVYNYVQVRILRARYRAVCGTAVALVIQDKMDEGGLSDHSPHAERMCSTQVLE